MSTIASPRDPSTNLRRIPSGTPTSSGRPSVDTIRSNVASPVPHATQFAPPPAAAPTSSKRSNRAALREYYNIRAAAAASATPRIEVLDSEIPPSELDAEDFNADEYVAKITVESSLQELLKLYTRVVSEVRALDAEKKALVYDNYSKLITATDTIRKMRANMDPLNPMASTLDPAIAQIYSQANSIRESLRQSVPSPDSEEGKQREVEQMRQRSRELAIAVLAVPEQLRALVKEGKMNAARKKWELPRKLLLSWKEKGIGGDDVQACIDEGDDAIGRVEGRSSAEQASKNAR